MILALFLLARADLPPPPPAPVPQAPAPAPNTIKLPTLTESKLTNGLVFSANLHDEYLAGSPLLVELSVRNTGTGTLSFPDLSARPFLVHFRVEIGKELQRSVLAWEGERQASVLAFNVRGSASTPAERGVRGVDPPEP